MTFDQFCDLSRTRIPTPKEFVAFVESQGWKVVVKDDKRASLRVKGKADRLALALAKMLGREPFRTNVLKAVMGEWRQEPEPAQAAPEPVAPAPVPPPEKEPASGREWLWRFGHRHTEREGDPLFGDETWHPAGAFWWRNAGESAWRLVPGRPGAEYPVPGGKEAAA